MAAINSSSPERGGGPPERSSGGGGGGVPRAAPPPSGLRPATSPFRGGFSSPAPACGAAYRYAASAARLAAIACSHLSPLASNLALSYSNSSRVSDANSRFGPSTIASTGQASAHSPQ